MNQIQLDENRLVPAIAQHAESGEVLMLGYMNPGSLSRTLESGEEWFYSRSRSDLWHKGEMSGSFLKVESTYVDCDGDTILLKVMPSGPVCHTGEENCFSTPLPEDFEFTRKDYSAGVLEDLFALIQDRKNTLRADSYTCDLFEKGVPRIAQKVIEEAGESSIAALTGRNDQLSNEMADLFYHCLVLLSACDIAPQNVWQVLRDRMSNTLTD